MFLFFFDMRCETTKLWKVVVLLFFFNAIYMTVEAQPQVPCLFIFGDSLSDSGNNNNLKTDAKVNFQPYGVDFPGGPTGRFTNGRTSVDIITQLLGFKDFIPPYANTKGADISLGVNYASGGAGIRNETGKHLGETVHLELQLEHHKDIISQITKKLGADKVQQHLNKCLYYVNIGSNDYLNNYFSREHYPSGKNFNSEQYAAALVQQLAISLKTLHGLGARKFSLIGVSLLGCVPHEIVTHGKDNSVCIDEANQAAQIYNSGLKKLVMRFNQELPDAKFIFINSVAIQYGHYESRGRSGLPWAKISTLFSAGGDPINFKPVTSGLLDIVSCCKVGSNGQCLANEEPCKGRNMHPFFDQFHPSEMTNQFSARNAYNAPIPALAYPMDISHLVKL